MQYLQRLIRSLSREYGSMLFFLAPNWVVNTYYGPNEPDAVLVRIKEMAVATRLRANTAAIPFLSSVTVARGNLLT